MVAALHESTRLSLSVQPVSQRHFLGWEGGLAVCADNQRAEAAGEGGIMCSGCQLAKLACQVGMPSWHGTARHSTAPAGNVAICCHASHIMPGDIYVMWRLSFLGHFTAPFDPKTAQLCKCVTSHCFVACCTLQAAKWWLQSRTHASSSVTACPPASCTPWRQTCASVTSSRQVSKGHEKGSLHSSAVQCVN